MERKMEVREEVSVLGWFIASEACNTKVNDEKKPKMRCFRCFRITMVET